MKGSAGLLPASLADMCTGPRRSSSFAHHDHAGLDNVSRTVRFLQSHSSSTNPLRTASSPPGHALTLMSLMPFVEIRSAHLSGAAGPDAQEGRASMKPRRSCYRLPTFHTVLHAGACFLGDWLVTSGL